MYLLALSLLLLLVLQRVACAFKNHFCMHKHKMLKKLLHKWVNTDQVQRNCEREEA